MPATAVKTIQLNTTGESNWGATGAATRKVRGVTDATLKIASALEVIPSLGWYGPSPEAEESAQSGEGSIDMIASYEELTRIFNGVFTAIAASTTTSGAPYGYPYTAPVLSTQASYTYTLEYGTTGACYRAPGSIINSLTIRGAAGGLWELTADILAKQIVASSSGLSSGTILERINPIRMADTKLYVDAFSTGTMGGTTMAATLIDFELTINPNRHLKTFAGSVNPSSWGDGKWESTLRLTAEYNASAKALVNELLGSTGAVVKRQIRIGALEGTSCSVKSVNLDFWGVKTEGETLFGDRDGNMTVELNWVGLYSTGTSGWFSATVQNGSSSTT